MAADPSQSSVEYFPRTIGLAKAGSVTTFSFLISGKEEKGAQTRVLNTFFVHGAKILFQSGYLDEKYNEFTLCVYCDLKTADISSDDLIIELRRFKFVVNAVSSSMKGRFFDRYLFPLTMMDSVRVVAVNSDFNSQLGERLRGNPQGKSALFELARSYALDLVKRIRLTMGKKTSLSNIQENSAAYLRTIGLGTFRSQSDNGAECVIIQDPPTSKSGEASGNTFIQGIASGLVEALKGRRMEIVRESYEVGGRMLTVTLAEKPTGIPSELSANSNLIPDQTEPPILQTSSTQTEPAITEAVGMSHRSLMNFHTTTSNNPP